MTRPSAFRNRIRSFGFAFAGIRTLLCSQPNARIHAFAMLAVVVAGSFCGLSATEWGLLVLAVTSVWIAEALNTALEFLADAASPDFHPLVKQAKDVAAAAVLISAMGSLVIGVLIFGPHLLDWIR